MQDYDGPHDYHPLIGEGTWPDPWVNALAFLVLILFIAACLGAYRYGLHGGAGERQTRRKRVIEDIVHAIRLKINVALLATGDRSFAPAREVVTTIEYYLQPLLIVAKELAGPVGKLSKALGTDTKEVEVKHEHSSGPPPAVHPSKAPPAMVFNGPTTVVPGGGIGCAPTCPPGCTEHGQKPAHDAHHGVAHGHKEPEKHKEPLSAKEKARLVREELEILSDYWVEAKVIEQLIAVRDCLLDVKLRPQDESPLGYGGQGALRSARRSRSGFEDAVGKAERDANAGFPWFKF